MGGIGGLEEARLLGGAAGSGEIFEAEFEVVEAGLEERHQAAVVALIVFGFGAQQEGAAILGAVENGLVDGVGGVEQQDGVGDLGGTRGGGFGHLKEEGKTDEDGDAENEGGEESPNGDRTLVPGKRQMGRGGRVLFHGGTAVAGKVVA
jgi:hypothetical protein